MRISTCLLLVLLPTGLITAQGRIISTFPYQQGFGFVPAGTAGAPEGPIGTRVFPRTYSDGGEFTTDGHTGASLVNASTTGLNNDGGEGGAIRIITSGSLEPTNAQGFVLHMDMTARTGGELSVEWFKVPNGTSTRRNELRVAASTDGAPFDDLKAVSFDNSSMEQSGSLRVELPSWLDGVSELRIWIYSVNVSGSGGHPRVVVDDLTVTAVPDEALPIQLSLFAVLWGGDRPMLEWRTASEIDNEGFEVLRAAADDSFATVASYTHHSALRGLGTSSVGRAYEYIDELPGEVRDAGGVLRYRLVAVSRDGSRHESGTRTLRIPGGTERADSARFMLDILGIAPLPAADRITLRFSSPQPSDATIDVFDLRGGRWARATNMRAVAGDNVAEVDLSGLAPGVYAVRLRTPSGVRTAPLVIEPGTSGS